MGFAGILPRSQTHHFCPLPLRRASISQRCPGQQLRGREAACDAELPGAPSCKGAQGPRGTPAREQGRKKGEWRVEVRPWLGCSSLLAGGRCTRSMREPEKGSLGTSWGGRALCIRKSPHVNCHFLAWILGPQPSSKAGLKHHFGNELVPAAVWSR